MQTMFVPVEHMNSQLHRHNLVSTVNHGLMKLAAEGTTLVLVTIVTLNVKSVLMVKYSIVR